MGSACLAIDETSRTDRDGRTLQEEDTVAKPPPFLLRPPSKHNKEHKALIVLANTLRAAAQIVATEPWLTYMSAGLEVPSNCSTRDTGFKTMVINTAKMQAVIRCMGLLERILMQILFSMNVTPCRLVNKYQNSF